jgi:hypothetical protein
MERPELVQYRWVLMLPMVVNSLAGFHPRKTEQGFRPRKRKTAWKRKSWEQHNPRIPRQ